MLEEKICEFERHIMCRILFIAEKLGDRFKANTPCDPLSESAFVVLASVLSCFELIHQLNTGTPHGKSARFFREGFQAVYPNTPYTTTEVERELYPLSRCGLYHAAM